MITVTVMCEVKTDIDGLVQFQEACIERMNKFQEESEKVFSKSQYWKERFSQNTGKLDKIMTCVQDASSNTLSGSSPASLKCKGCAENQFLWLKTLQVQNEELEQLFEIITRSDAIKSACKQLEKCTNTCQGPSQEVLGFKTHTTSCSAEAYLHRFIGKGIIVLCVYFFLNSGRIILFSGLRRVFFSDLFDGNYQVR